MQEMFEGGEHNSAKDFMKDFLSEESSARKPGEGSKLTGKGKDTHLRVFDAIEISDSETEDDDNQDPFDLPSTSNPVIQLPPSKRLNAPSLPKKGAGSEGSSGSRTNTKPFNPGRMVQDEMQTRKREALGMIGGRKLGSTPKSETKPSAGRVREPTNTSQSVEKEAAWACKICTL